MFLEFWEKRKHLIECVGILTAVGALFLNISAPEGNEGARLALINIQFIWLIVISLALLILAVQFIDLVFRVENILENKWGIYTSMLSFAVLMLIWKLVENLWRYIIALYPHQAQVFFVWTYIISGGLIVIFYKKLISIIYNWKKGVDSAFLMYSLGAGVVLSFIPASFAQLAILEFEIWIFMSSLLGYLLLSFGGLTLLMIIQFLYIKKYGKSFL